MLHPILCHEEPDDYAPGRLFVGVLVALPASLPLWGLAWLLWELGADRLLEALARTFGAAGLLLGSALVLGAVYEATEGRRLFRSRGFRR